MKGMIFTEFLELVERTYSPEMADELIDASDLPSGGAYTSVGNYDHREMVALVMALHRRTDRPVDELLHWFGLNLFTTLAAGFPVFFDVLSGIETVIHTEVRKLYPDAELPEFTVLRPAPDTLQLDYRSPRCMDDVAHGLIDGCLAHFDRSILLTRRPLGRTQADGTRFTLVDP
jgi:hypothetical protein